MKAFLLSLMLLLTPLVASAQKLDADEVPPSGDEVPQVHSIQSLPEGVLSAARRVAPDVYFQEAESFWDADSRVYRLTGRLMREIWYVTVRNDGRVLSVVSDFADN